MRIGLIGAGRMGRPIVQRLESCGHEVTVFARRPEARVGRYADTVEATVRDADLVLNVVQSDAQVRAVWLGPESALAAMKQGATLVQHTTCDPATVEQLARAGQAHGIAVLDAALSGGPHDIAAGTLTLWVGGEEAQLEALRPILRSYASPITWVGAVGDGQRVKLVNNALFVSQVGLVVEALRVAGELGIDERRILAALQQGSATSRALEVVARAGSVAAVGERLATLMRKDVDVVREVARRAGADLGVLETVLASDAVELQVLRSIRGAP